MAPFKRDFQPEKVLEQQEIVTEFTDGFSEIVQGWGTPNIRVYGQEGLGKTTVTNYLLDQLREEMGSDLTVISVDCREHDTIYRTFLFLANELSEEQFKRGHPTNTLREKIYSGFDRIGGVILLVFDNAEELDDNPINEFQHVQADGDVVNADIGVIEIYDSSGLSNHISGKLHSDLRTRTIEFTPYDAQELKNILQFYADKAFQPGVLDNGVVPKCAAISAQLDGDVQSGLILLKLSGKFAEEEGSNRVTEDHVDKAVTKLDVHEMLETFIHKLTRQEQLVCLIIALLEKNKEIEPKFKHIYLYYDEYCEVVGLNKVGERQVRNYLNTVREEGLVLEKKHEVGKCRKIDVQTPTIWHTYALEAPHEEAVYEAIIETAVAEFALFRRIVWTENES